eukprot:13946333-Heterocapsa_arctica.AAC.1
MDALLEMHFDANPFGVTAVQPVNPTPPAKTTDEAADINVSAASIAELQSGVKQPEPPVPKKQRWGKGGGKTTARWKDMGSDTEQ